MRSGHDVRGQNPKQRFIKSQEIVLVCVRRTEMATEGKCALGFGLSHHFIVARAIWAVTVHNTSPKIAECTNGP
jgi:hypothetical protein